MYYSALDPERCLSILSTCSPLCFPTCRYRYKLHRDRWHGLWWVILLQYTHVVYASMSILNCPNIESQSSTGGSVSGLQLFPDAVLCACYKEVLLLMHTSILLSFLQQWFVSGNINCFDGWHVPLGILAILSLAFCVSIVVIFVLYAFKWLEVSACWRSVGLSTHYCAVNCTFYE